MYLCDIHSHTKVSHDSTAELSDMARAAISAGLRELCVTDHHDLLDFDGRPAPPFDWPAAKAQYRAVKAQLGAGGIFLLCAEKRFHVFRHAFPDMVPQNTAGLPVSRTPFK